jgi:hypothetical protein
MEGRSRREAKKIGVPSAIRDGLKELALDHGADIARMLSLNSSLSAETIADELEKVRLSNKCAQSLSLAAPRAHRKVTQVPHSSIGRRSVVWISTGFRLGDLAIRGSVP